MNEASLDRLCHQIMYILSLYETPKEHIVVNFRKRGLAEAEESDAFPLSKTKTEDTRHAMPKIIVTSAVTLVKSLRYHSEMIV